MNALPARCEVVLADQVYVDRSGLPGSDGGPTRQHWRRSRTRSSTERRRCDCPTFGKPRIISCAELHPRHVGLPRGCLDECGSCCDRTGSASSSTINARWAVPANVRFLGTLPDVQDDAVEALVPHDFGVLAATTAFGKTVVGATLIARAAATPSCSSIAGSCSISGWSGSGPFCRSTPAQIGIIGGGKRKPTGRIDVALIQSLVRNGEVSDLVGRLRSPHRRRVPSPVRGQLRARRPVARRPGYVLGLSATVARKDGHHPIIFMQCGPVRHRVDARSQAARRAFAHLVRLRETGFRLLRRRAGRTAIDAGGLRRFGPDDARNDIIFDDVLSPWKQGAHPSC